MRCDKCYMEAKFTLGCYALCRQCNDDEIKAMEIARPTEETLHECDLASKDADVAEKIKALRCHADAEIAQRDVEISRLKQEIDNHVKYTLQLHEELHVERAELQRMLKTGNSCLREMHLHSAHASYCAVRGERAKPCNCGLQVAEGNMRRHLESSEKILSRKIEAEKHAKDDQK